MQNATCLALACLTWAAQFAIAADEIPWATDFRAATEQATREKKLVLLHFWSDDCPPCRRVEANVFSRPDVAQAVAAAYVPVKVHVDKAPELARRYQVTRWPTDVIISPTGLEVYRTVSPQNPTQYMAMLSDTAAKSGSALARNANAPSAAKVASTQRPGTPRGSSNDEFTPPTIEKGTAAAPPTASNNAGPPPYQSGASNQNAAGQMQTNPHQSIYQVGATSPAAGAANSSEYGGVGYQPEASAAAPSKGLDSEYGAPQPASGQDAAPPQTSIASEKSAAPPARTSEPVADQAPLQPGLPPLGMEGYCVISLADQAKWLKGDKRFGAIHRGRLYLFANAECQKKFLADPDRFSPALSGYDPVRYAEGGQLVDGRRAHGLAFNGQTYLFSDEASLKKFQANPKAFADTVYQAMLRTDGGTKQR